MNYKKIYFALVCSTLFYAHMHPFIQHVQKYYQVPKHSKTIHMQKSCAYTAKKLNLKLIQWLNTPTNQTYKDICGICTSFYKACQIKKYAREHYIKFLLGTCATTAVCYYLIHNDIVVI